jgi:ATP-binding cassette subfamily B protein
MTAPRRYGDRALYRRLLGEARPFWPHLVGVLLFDLLAAPIALLQPLPLKIVVDSVLGSAPLPAFLEAVLPNGAARSALIVALALLIGIALLDRLRALGHWLLGTYTGEQLSLGFRCKLLQHLQRLSLSYHDQHSAADALYRLQYDAPSVQWISINGIIPMLTAALTVVAMIGVTARLDPQLALVALGVAPVLFALVRVHGRRLRSRWHQVKDSESSALAVAHEGLSAARVVRAFGGETREQERFVEHASRGARGQVRVAALEGGFGVLVGLTVTAGTAAALFVGVLHVQSGVLTLGELLVVLSYLARLYDPLETVSKQLVTLESSMVGAERSFALLDEPPDVDQRSDARPIARAGGAVEFQRVSFNYPGGDLVLRDVSFEVQPGARVAIVGRTGAGKSTLMSLLIRFFDPTSGRILLDGVDLRDYRLADLRGQFAIVLQEPILFSTSVAENIAYARPHASRADVVAAATAADAHEFIEKLPAGYDTLVGERGALLSGGQRQRISLARAFLKDAPILLFDEPTSSVDADTEATILDAMQRLMRGRTAFLIAHRAATLRGCDVFLTIDEGQLVGDDWSRSAAGALASGS